MPDTADKWAEIEAAYRAGMPMAELRERFGVALAEVFVRAKAGGWTRTSKDATPPGGPGDGGESVSDSSTEPPTCFPVLIDSATSAVIDEVVHEAVADIVASHKAIGRKLRKRFEAELAEFDAFAAVLASFGDDAHITQLAAKKDGGKELRAYLAQCLASHAKRTDVLDRLVRIGGQIVNLERAAWGIADGNGDENETSYEDLLEELRKPLAPRVLPENVVAFERRIATTQSKKES